MNMRVHRSASWGVLLLFIAGGAAAGSPGEEWRDPRIVERNKERPFATHFPFASVAEALQNEPRRAANYLSLNGEWRFHWAPRPADAPRDFWKPGFDWSRWNAIPVPANWVRHGYGRYQYADEEYNFPYDPPRVPEDDNPVGSYIHEFAVPQDWAGRRIFIHFGAVRTAFYLWVNGRAVGYSEDSRLPAEFDVTQFVTPGGKNTLAVQVLQWADAAYLEGQDMWRMGGIERDVYLYSAPATRIRDLFVRATLDDANRDGLLDVDVDLVRTEGGAPPGRLRFSVHDGARTVFSSEAFARPAKDAGVFNLKTRIAAPKHWTAETPNLYAAVLELYDRQGVLIEATSLKIGFRRVEIKNGLLLVNGRPITIRGVNRQELDPRTLHVVSRELTRRDVELMKQFNVNALRTSHYPNDPYLYQLADEFGLYVVDEANVESHEAMNRNDHLAERPEFAQAHLSRMEAMVERDKNHPSVIIWSLGNEAGGGAAFREMYRRTKMRDPSRPIQYEAAGDVDYTDLYVPMYAKLWDVSKYLASKPAKPLVLCEYAHMMGNSGGTLHDYWKLFATHPQAQGGFVWDWVDQSLEVRRSDGRVYYGYPGDYVRDGIEFSFTDGVMSSQREPHPHAWDLKKAYQPVDFQADDLLHGEIRIVNRYDFRDLDALQFAWRIEEDGVEIASGPLRAPPIPARAAAAVRIPLPQITPRVGAEYFLEIEARARAADGLIPAGHLIASEQFALPLYSQPQQCSASRTAQLRVVEGDSQLEVHGSELVARFDKASGALVSLESERGELLERALAPFFWRAPTDNDIGAGLPERLAIWKTLPASAALRSFTHSRNSDGSVSVRTHSILGSDAVKLGVEYRVTPSGAVGVAVQFDPKAIDLPFLPRLGMRFAAHRELAHVEWFGRGPQESYSDRWQAAPIGRYAGAVARQAHAYVRPQESGNKVDVRWMAVRDAAGAGLLVLGAPHFSGGASAVLDEDIDHSPARQLHSIDVQPRDFTVVHVDYRQMGLGGDDSWRSTAHPQHLIWPTRYQYGFVLKPLKPGEDPAALARQPCLRQAALGASAWRDVDDSATSSE